MNGEFKKCPNGHYYQGATCPFCKTNGTSNSGPTQRTFVNPMSEGGSETTNSTTNGGGWTRGSDTVGTQSTGIGSGNKTTMVEPNGDTVVGGPGVKGNTINPGTRTVFEDEEASTSPTGEEVKQRVARNSRKLVGWIVTYSLDPMGVDYKLYEGRNVIGRDADCSITVGDGTVSAKHAVLLYRAGKYSITDQQSSHGTFVNGEDIELNPKYLKDGDLIRVGNTVFMIRFALFDENC